MLKANKPYYKSNNSNECKEELNDNSRIKEYYNYIENKYKVNK